MKRRTDALESPSRRAFLAGGGAALAAGLVGAASETVAENGFRFVFMPDFHLRREFGSAEGMTKALKAAMGLTPKPAFVVTGVDLCHSTWVRYGTRSLQRGGCFRVPVASTGWVKR